MLYLIGIGLNNERDITLKGLGLIKKSKKVYLDNYTSRLNCSIEDLERLYKKKIIVADRELIEDRMDLILKEAKKNDVALLIIGAPLAATTHINFILEAKKRKIPFKVVENSSVYSAIGITGLFLYKFGRATTIPFDNKDVKSCYEVYLKNQKIGLHTLFLLDIKDKMMNVNDGLEYMIRMGLNKNKLVVACSKLGADDFEIKVGKAKDLLKYRFKKFPQCFIIPAKLNFMEEEMLKLYK
jgi:diphthine synthase